MVSSDLDEEWAKLSEAETAEREAKMVARYEELAGLSEDERRARLRAMARAEYSLSDERLRPFTISRMRTWLALDEDKAGPVAQSYDAVMQEMPATIAMRRVALVQTLVREFSVEDEERLRRLIPRVFAGAPSRLTGLERSESPLQTETATRKKPWWAFWRGG